MNSTISVPYSWLKTLDPELLKVDSIPLLGNPPSFPWEQFTKELGKFFHVDDLSIHPNEIRWKSPSEIFEGFSLDRQSINIAFSSIDGHICFTMNTRDIAFLMTSLISQKAAAGVDLDIDKDFILGFYSFAAMEAMNVFTHIDFDKTLTPQLLDDHTEPTTVCLSQDIDIKLFGKNLTGRLLIPPQFHDAWKENYSQRKLKTSLSKSLAEKIELTIHLEGGRSALSMNDLKNLHTGDFIILDSYSLDPEYQQSKVTITLEGVPLHGARLEQGSLIILESPSIQEVVQSMDKNYNSDDENEIQQDDELHEDHELDELEDQVDIHLDEEEEEFSEESDAKVKPTSQQVVRPPKPTQQVQSNEEKKPFTPEEIPVNLIIEAGRLQISIQKLLDLQPGNILELDVKPENGVNLVVNSRIIGRGELLKVGETLGVRVLDLG